MNRSSKHLCKLSLHCSVWFILLVGHPTSAQELPLGPGVEPSLATNRRASNNNPVLALCWMDGVNKLVWRRSTNQGAGFLPAQEIWLGSPAKHIDPTLASSGANGHIYFGFLGAPTSGQTGTSRTLKLDGTFGPDSFMMGGDSPWLLGVEGKPYVAWPGRSIAQELVSLKCRAGVEQGNAALEWGEIKTAATVVSGLEFSAQAGFAGGRSNNGSPTLVLGALQYSKTNPLAGGTGFYAYRSGDGGQTWNPVPGIDLDFKPRRTSIRAASSQSEI